MASQAQPLYIVSVNNTPQRAKELVAILIEGVSEKYNLIHAANTSTIKGVRPLLESLVIAPQILICSSQWTATQQQEVQILAKELIPGIKIIAIPSGLNAKMGGEAVVKFLNDQVNDLGLPERAQCPTCT